MQTPRRDGSAARYGTGIVLVNLAVNLLHGAAHRELHIDLNTAEQAFVVAVILIGPLLAMALLGTRWQRAGLGLLAATMAASLAFGLYHHFMAPGPDQVGAQAAGFWGTTFGITAGLLFLAEAAGIYVGVRFLRTAFSLARRG
jgi:hypothetical protein